MGALLVEPVPLTALVDSERLGGPGATPRRGRGGALLELELEEVALGVKLILPTPAEIAPTDARSPSRRFLCGGAFVSPLAADVEGPKWRDWNILFYSYSKSKSFKSKLQIVVLI